MMMKVIIIIQKQCFCILSSSSFQCQVLKLPTIVPFVFWETWKEPKPPSAHSPQAATTSISCIDSRGLSDSSGYDPVETSKALRMILTIQARVHHFVGKDGRHDLEIYFCWMWAIGQILRVQNIKDVPNTKVAKVKENTKNCLKSGTILCPKRKYNFFEVTWKNTCDYL